MLFFHSNPAESWGFILWEEAGWDSKVMQSPSNPNESGIHWKHSEVVNPWLEASPKTIKNIVYVLQT